MRSGDRAADCRIDADAYENEKREDYRALVTIAVFRGRRVDAPRCNKMGGDYTEGKKDRYRDA